MTAPSPDSTRDPGTDPTERVVLEPSPVARTATTRRAGSVSALSISALLIGAVVVVAVIALRPGPGAGDAAATSQPSPTAPAPAATGAAPPSEIAPTPEIEQTAAPTVAPTEVPPTPKPTKKPAPEPTVPATFSATLTVTPSCSTAPGMEGVSLMASFAGPDFITRVVLYVDGVEVAPVDFDAPGLQVGGAGSGTSVTPDVAHEATAAFYSGAGRDVLVHGGVSSGSFTVALTADCG